MSERETGHSGTIIILALRKIKNFRPRVGVVGSSVVKRTFCSFRGPKSDSQHPPITPAPEEPMLSSGLHSMHAHMHTVFLNKWDREDKSGQPELHRNPVPKLNKQ